MRFARALILFGAVFVAAAVVLDLLGVHVQDKGRSTVGRVQGHSVKDGLHRQLLVNGSWVDVSGRAYVACRDGDSYPQCAR